MEETRMIDAASITAYDRDGAVALRGVFDPHWVALLAAGVERNLREPGPYGKRYTPDGKPGLFFGDYCSWSRIPEYEAFLRHSPAAAIAGALMESRKVNLFHEHVLVKEPGTEEPTPWHNDQPYWTVEGWQVCSLWIPLDPVARENGVEYVAGSHRRDEWFKPKRFVDSEDHPSDDPRFLPVPDVEGNRAAYTLLGWDLEPGDCVAFHGLTLHGAPGNRRSDRRRRAVSARWTGDDAVFTRRTGIESPPAPANGPAPGGPMDSPAFPVVWREG
jgi:ectoine hydroxylase-related dioxygenase (phytanoyl-CoA dioxygenase family)